MECTTLFVFTVLVFCIFSCSKSKSPAPQTTGTTKPDSIKQFPAVFTAYTDTFYGMAEENDGSFPIDTLTYVYAYHRAQDTIIFSLTYPSSTSPYSLVGGITGTFATDSSNYYSSPSTSYYYNNLTIVKDSLFFYGTTLYGPDAYTLSYSGKRINKYVNTR